MPDPVDLGARLLVIFDGRCGLCNWSVRWFLERDQRDRFRFAPSDSPQVTELLRRHGIGRGELNLAPSSVLVVLNAGKPEEALLEESSAVLALLLELPRPWPHLAVLLRWIPAPVLDLLYRLVARWRYRVRSRLETCPVPSAEEQSRFL
jgi:predicted DCC family thiol-disulfide oxidoreductase YuxK